MPRASTAAALSPDSWAGSSSVTRASVAVAAPEEREPVNMVPVQVGEEDGAGERLAAEQRGDLAEAGARVEHERRPGRVVVADRHA